MQRWRQPEASPRLQAASGTIPKIDRSAKDKPQYAIFSDPLTAGLQARVGGDLHVVVEVNVTLLFRGKFGVARVDRRFFYDEAGVGELNRAMSDIDLHVLGWYHQTLSGRSGDLDPKELNGVTSLMAPK
ncbi:MAG: hypothetical protein JO015_15980 [Verrucomicrobia bacterium]|nr:hypothetical protein [Verrucomicrobiota bacterium]